MATKFWRRESGRRRTLEPAVSSVFRRNHAIRPLTGVSVSGDPAARDACKGGEWRGFRRKDASRLPDARRQNLVGNPTV